MKYSKEILFTLTLVIAALIVWYAIDVFLLTFATILLAILLQSIGKWAQKLIRLPYVLSLMIALCVVAGVFILIFWLYSPVIAQQTQLLIKQLPEAALNLRKTLTPYLRDDFFSPARLREELSLANQAIFRQVMTLFSTTVGSIVSFAIFLIVGFYLALFPSRYVKGVFFLVPEHNKDKIYAVIENIDRSIRFWLLGKILSMIVIGVLTFFGLWLLNISLAFILGLLAGLLTFIPYVGPILAAIPAILIAFTENPLKGLYVIILYLAIHIAEGYLITPFIEQKTVSVPPALTIMGQVLLFVLVGGLGLALATPIIVVIMALVISLKTMNTALGFH